MMRIRALVKRRYLRNDIYTQQVLCVFRRKLISKSSTSRYSARTVKQLMQLFKAQIVQSMNDEYKEMMRQAVDEVSVIIT